MGIPIAQVNHNVFTKPPKLQTGEVHWIDAARMLWRSLMNFGLWMRDAVQSVPGFLPAAASGYASEPTSKRISWPHPIRFLFVLFP